MGEGFDRLFWPIILVWSFGAIGPQWTPGSGETETPKVIFPDCQFISKSTFKDEPSLEGGGG